MQACAHKYTHTYTCTDAHRTNSNVSLMQTQLYNVLIKDTSVSLMFDCNIVISLTNQPPPALSYTCLHCLLPVCPYIKPCPVWYACIIHWYIRHQPLLTYLHQSQKCKRFKHVFIASPAVDKIYKELLQTVELQSIWSVTSGSYSDKWKTTYSIFHPSGA